ncbi:MAG: hypothetical protein MR455_07610 [Prevotella sp.]|nr:hypothetical protein [Prevotella sp.]
MNRQQEKSSPSVSLSFLVWGLSVLLSLSVPLALAAQKKVIAQAEIYLKSGKELPKAEKLLADLLADSANQRNMKIRLLLFDAVRKQYEQGNEKLFLRQKYDTTSLFIATKKMFYIAEGIDSIDASPDKHGRIRLKYRKKNGEYLQDIRPNLFNGGTFFSQKQDYERAFDFYETYIRTAASPLFTLPNNKKEKALMHRAAYGTVYCGYKMQNPDKTLRYLDLAMNDKDNAAFVFQYGAAAHLLHRDTTRYIAMLWKGFRHEPDFAYFFPRLVDYYQKVNRPDSAMYVIDRALSIDSANVVYLLAKSNVLLNMGHYEECIAICESLLSRNDTLPDVYLNIGLAYFNQAVELDKRARPTKDVQRRTRAFYEKSRVPMETYRRMMPQEERRWYRVLYTIYLNLNMGKEFDEIERYRQARQTL